MQRIDGTRPGRSRRLPGFLVRSAGGRGAPRGRVRGSRPPNAGGAVVRHREEFTSDPENGGPAGDEVGPRWSSTPTPPRCVVRLSGRRREEGRPSSIPTGHVVQVVVVGDEPQSRRPCWDLPERLDRGRAGHGVDVTALVNLDDGVDPLRIGGPQRKARPLAAPRADRAW